MLLARRALARRAAIPVAALRPRAFSLSVSPLAPINLNAWLAEHGPTLKPPVANKLLFGDGDLKVMVGTEQVTVEEAVFRETSATISFFMPFVAASMPLFMPGTYLHKRAVKRAVRREPLAESR